MGFGDWFKGILGKEEEPQEHMAPCDRCGFEYPQSLLIKGGSASFCSECNTKRKREAEEADFKRRQALAIARVKYYCYNCKFHFSRKKEFGIQLCPNCGSSNFVEEDRLV
jgi:DNA-directed RNA polymerase subunit RPC12/RpoP